MKLTIGNLHFDSCLIQGPLAGYSCAPMRALPVRFGGLAYTCTEMISAKHLVAAQSVKSRYTLKHPQEGTVCYQLSGNDPETLARAAQIVVTAGADLLDLNCGCPVAKMRKKGVGSALLTQSDTLHDCVLAMRQAVTVPITVKIRVDANSGDQYNHEVVAAVTQAGADALVVHGRHWTHRYDVDCYFEEIADIVAQTNIPVIGNGDVKDATTLQKMLNETGCAGVMISRACVGQPWLFAELLATYQQQTYPVPSLPEVGALLLEHVCGLVELEGEKFGILQSRKLSKYYARTMSNKTEFVVAMEQVSTYAEVETLVQRYFSA